MLVRTIRLILVSLVIPSAAAAQVPADTAAPYQQPPVTVHASSLMPRSAATMGNVVRLDGWSIRRMDGRTIDAVLEEEGGLFVRDVGGPGGVKTVSLRNSPATQTVFQLNGMRLNNPQNSLVDLGLYPTALFDAVEVVRGGQSSLFGADANAGAVVLGLWPSMADRFSVGGQAGSFGERGLHLRWDQAGSHAATSIRFGVDRSDGDFPFTWTDATGTRERVREGGSQERWHVAGSAVVHGISWGHVEVTILGVASDRGSPGPVTNGVATLARLRDNVAHAVVRAVHSGPQNEGWEAGLSTSFQEETYEDRANIFTSPDRFVTRVLAGWFQHRLTLADGLAASSGIELSTSSLEGHAIAPETRRIGGSAMVSIEWTEPKTGLRMMPMLRWDVQSDQRPTFGPRVAAEWPLTIDRSLIARASVGTGVRTPNFNELYWQPGGDPALRPERVTTADAGVHFRAVPDEALAVSLNGFIADTRDRITGWPPVNLARTFVRGIDASAVWRSAVVRWWINGTLALAESRSPSFPGRQVPYVPRWVAATGADVRVGEFTLSPVIRSTSRRFTTMDNLASLSIPPATRASLTGRMTLRAWGRGVALVGSVDDLFDAAGTSVPGYPLPGRSYHLRVTVELD